MLIPGQLIKKDGGTFTQKIVFASVLMFGAFGIAAPALVEATGLLRLVGRSIEWYRQIDAMQDRPGSTREVVIRQLARQHARQALKYEFQFATAQAAIIDSTQKQNVPTTSPVARIHLLLQQANDRISLAQTQLNQVNSQLTTVTGSKRAALLATQDKLNAQINLATAEHDTLEGYAQFLNKSETGQSASLSDRVATLEQSVPELAEKSSSDSTSGSEPVFDADNAGVFSMTGQAFALGARLNQLNALARTAATLSYDADQLRQPLRAAVIDAVHRGDAVSTTQPSADPAEIAAQGRQLNDLAARFRQLSAASVPLAEAKTMLDTTRQDLLDWHTAVDAAYGEIVHALLWKFGGMAGTIILVFVVSEFWRRATFRYVHDIRRRRQLMLVRRIVVGIFILLIVIATVATEISQLATFAGLITAGIAVALQTVILSGVAYFFFIGRFGVRVGDRVTISGVTGDVVEIGIFRLYLMELKGDSSDMLPTGRIVVFSNSVLFQPSAFYKQLPGADYVWHEQTFAMGPNVDYAMAEDRLLAAVNEVFETYKNSIEQQHAAATSTSLHVAMEIPHPEGRMRFVGDHLEFVIRYPVEIHRASQIDDQVTRKLLQVIAQEPGLKELKPAGTSA